MSGISCADAFSDRKVKPSCTLGSAKISRYPDTSQEYSPGNARQVQIHFCPGGLNLFSKPSIFAAYYISVHNQHVGSDLGLKS